MILDWNKYCEKVYKTKTLDREDASDNKSVFSQEAHYLKFLVLRKYSLEKIYAEWLMIKNGIALTAKEDPELQKAFFSKIYRMALQIPNYIFGRVYEPVRIYESEKTFLNNIDAPKWVKQYWCAMLIYWKFASQYSKKVEINTTLCNWAMRQTDLKDNYYSHHQETIAKYNLQPNATRVLTTDIVNKHGKRTYNFTWIGKKSEKVVCVIKSLDKINESIDNILVNISVCPQCGKHFVRSNKSKIVLCPDCYKKERRKYNAIKQKEYYYSFKNKEKNSVQEKHS